MDQFFRQKLSFAWYSFTSNDTCPALTTLRIRAIAGYPSADVSPGMSGRLTNTAASTKLVRIVDTVTHSASPACTNPPSIHISSWVVFAIILNTSVWSGSMLLMLQSLVCACTVIETVASEMINDHNRFFVVNIF
jgi:hypothetical protein